MAGKSLDKEQRKVVSDFVRELVNTWFEGNQTRAANAMDVSQGQVSDVISGNRGAGLKLLAGLRKVTGLAYEDIIAGAPVPPPGTKVVASPPAPPKPELIYERDVDDRYPERVDAVRIARRRGWPEAVIKEVVSHRSKGQDHTVEKWLGWMEDLKDDLEAGRRVVDDDGVLREVDHDAPKLPPKIPPGPKAEGF